MAEPDAIAPAVPFAAALAASVVTSKNFGSATAARIPRMAMTVTNSMIVNPLAPFISRSLYLVLLVNHPDPRATLRHSAAGTRKRTCPRCACCSGLERAAHCHGGVRSRAARHHGHRHGATPPRDFVSLE